MLYAVSWGCQKEMCEVYSNGSIKDSSLPTSRNNYCRHVWTSGATYLYVWSVTREVLHFLGRETATLKLHKIFLPLNIVMDFSSPFCKLANDVHWQSETRWSRSPRARKNVCWNIADWFSFKVVLQYLLLLLLLYSVRNSIFVTRID